MKITLPMATELVKHRGEVHVSGHSWVQVMDEMSQERHVKVECAWLNHYKGHPDLFGQPVLGSKDSSTYRDCVKGKLFVKAGALHFKLTIWDGDLLDGSPTNCRCEFTIRVPYIHDELKPVLERRINQVAEMIVEEEEMEEHRRRIARAREEFVRMLKGEKYDSNR